MCFFVFTCWISCKTYFMAMVKQGSKPLPKHYQEKTPFNLRSLSYPKEEKAGKGRGGEEERYTGNVRASSEQNILLKKKN